MSDGSQSESFTNSMHLLEVGYSLIFGKCLYILDCTKPILYNVCIIRQIWSKQVYPSNGGLSKVTFSKLLHTIEQTWIIYFVQDPDWWGLPTSHSLEPCHSSGISGICNICSICHPSKSYHFRSNIIYIKSFSSITFVYLCFRMKLKPYVAELVDTRCWNQKSSIIPGFFKRIICVCIHCSKISVFSYSQRYFYQNDLN